MATTGMTSAGSARERAHRRFVRAVVVLYAGAAAVSLTILGLGLVADRVDQERDLRAGLMQGTIIRADSLARHLAMLVSELVRLGLRSEVDLMDANDAPERALLRLASEDSAFFDVGAALLDGEGRRIWSEPGTFLPGGADFGAEKWFRNVRRSKTVRIVPIQPEDDRDAILYVVAPVVRDKRFVGAILGGIDLAKGDDVVSEVRPLEVSDVFIVTREADVIYPAAPPRPLVDSPAWREVIDESRSVATAVDGTFDGLRLVVASSDIAGTDFSLVTTTPTYELFAPVRQRLVSRLAIGATLALVPLLALVLLLRRSLAVFRRSEEAAVHDERLLHLGEAVHLIAHEVKNSLNGIRLGLDLMQRRGPDDAKLAPMAVRSEIERLADFTAEMLLFSRGIEPRPASLDIAALIGRACESVEAQALEAGVTIACDAVVSEPTARADPMLIHTVLVNLIRNAIDALSTVDREKARVDVVLRDTPDAVSVRVRDNGPGLPEDVVSRLFEPFVSGKPSGTGLGLTLSKRIVDAHGGALSLVRSTPAGAEFLVHLPRGGPSCPPVC